MRSLTLPHRPHPLQPEHLNHHATACTACIALLLLGSHNVVLLSFIHTQWPSLTFSLHLTFITANTFLKPPPSPPASPTRPPAPPCCRQHRPSAARLLTCHGRRPPLMPLSRPASSMCSALPLHNGTSFPFNPWRFERRFRREYGRSRFARHGGAFHLLRFLQITSPPLQAKLGLSRRWLNRSVSAY